MTQSQLGNSGLRYSQSHYAHNKLSPLREHGLLVLEIIERVAAATQARNLKSRIIG